MVAIVLLCFFFFLLVKKNTHNLWHHRLNWPLNRKLFTRSWPNSRSSSDQFRTPSSSWGSTLSTRCIVSTKYFTNRSINNESFPRRVNLTLHLGLARSATTTNRRQQYQLPECPSHTETKHIALLPLVPPCILCIMIGLLAAFKNLYRLNFIADTKRPLAQDFPVQFPGNNKTIEPKILATWRRDWEIRILWKWPRTWTSELWTMQVKETHGMLLKVTQRTKQGSERGLK